MPRLDETYRRRALPPGSPRHLSWLFSAAAVRDPLLAVYALLAEWRATMHAGVDPATAAGKLAWWQEEMRRLSMARPVHPVSRFLASLPGADEIAFDPLEKAIDAAVARITGQPLTRREDLADRADALIGGPLRIAIRLGSTVLEPLALEACTRALACGEYLARALEERDQPGAAGRVLFAAEELHAAGISAAALYARDATPALREFLERVRRDALDEFSRAAQSLAVADRPPCRGLLVLGALQAHHLRAHRPVLGNGTSFLDPYRAWRIARQAARAA